MTPESFDELALAVKELLTPIVLEKCGTIYIGHRTARSMEIKAKGVCFRIHFADTRCYSDVIPQNMLGAPNPILYADPEFDTKLISLVDSLMKYTRFVICTPPGTP